MSGLTMGLMSLDKLNLKILANGYDNFITSEILVINFPISTEEKTKRHASRILPLVERHHWLLVTLLLSNAACAEVH